MRDNGDIEEEDAVLTDYSIIKDTETCAMRLHRGLPKEMGSFLLLAAVVSCLVVFGVVMYATQDISGRFYATSEEEEEVFQSYAYRQQQEDEMIDVEEDINSISDENVEEFQTLSYKDALQKTADPSGTILIKFCEEGRMDSAINFHETSVVDNEINNVLYVSPDIRVCTELWKLEIRCHVMEDDFMMFNNSQILESSRTGGRKVTIARLKLILKALTSGYTVLFTDLNTLYMKNPFEQINCGEKCDVAVSVDNISMNFANWAIHLAKPRKSTVYMYARLLTIMGTMSVVSTKDVLNRVIDEMVNMKQLQVEYLDAEKFTPASFYFMVRRFQEDDNKCRSCVAVFEDRGLSRADQIYQLKEVHLWHANFDEYYTSRRRSYIIYENIWDYGERRSIVQELIALRNALAIGQALGRIVILPRFHCPESVFESKFCGLCDLMKMTDFDEQFSDMYREHTFLDHPEVSREVRRTVTDPYYIGSKLPDDVDRDPDSELKKRKTITFLEPQHARGLTAEELEAIFRTETSYNLLFHSLYEGFAGFEDTRTASDFNRKIRHAFQLNSPIQELVGDKSFEIL